MMKRKIGLDVGDVRIGVAVSDLMGICANPRETYVRKKDDVEADAEYFADYARREDADALATWTAPKVRAPRSRGSSETCSKRGAGSTSYIRTKD